MIRLLLADRHAILRTSLKLLFAQVAGMEVVAEAADCGELLARLHQGGIDLVLLDMDGIGTEGLLARLRAHYPDLPVLALSAHSQAEVAQCALRAGASGLLCKDKGVEMLLAAIRRVVAGGRFIDPAVAEEMAFKASGITPSPQQACLSRRELEIFRLIAQGARINDIAATLSISSKTVTTHKRRLMDKMGFASNADLVRYAMKHETPSWAR
jgi:DNA-binding NarL/FixJ family response regulator